MCDQSEKVLKYKLGWSKIKIKPALKPSETKVQEFEKSALFCCYGFNKREKEKKSTVGH
jgi:hypothetical protein